MNPDNPYAAPQAALDQSTEPVVIEGELAFLADPYLLQRGAEQAGAALGHAISLVFSTLGLGLVFGEIAPLMILLGVAVLLIAQRICWRFYTGLSQMAAAARLFLGYWLVRAKLAFLVGWICYGAKLLILVLFDRQGRGVSASLDVLDSAAGATVALSLGIAALRLGRELHLSGLRRAAWLTMIFLGGSHLVFLLMELSLLVDLLRPRNLGGPIAVEWVGLDSFFFVIAIPAFAFITGYFSLMGLLSQLSRLPIRVGTEWPYAESILDVETIERRRRVAEG